MPLYMDIHTVDSEDFSVEDVVTAHMEDLAVQEKFGVIQIKYWVDTENKKIFCLMEGPSKEACNAVHVESHGNTACNIIEVSDDEYNLFLNIGKKKNDLAHTLSGELDTGYRTLLMISTFDFTGKYKDYINKIHELIKQNSGVIVLQPNDDIMVSFISSSESVICALAILKLLKSIPDNYLYKLAIVTGKPVDESGTNLFENTKKKVRHLNKIGFNGIIYMDTVTKSLSEKESSSTKINQKDFKVLSEVNFSFLNKLFSLLDIELYNSDFKSEKLYTPLGLSKSQAYRNIKSLTKMAPNKLIQELRLQESLKEIKNNRKSVAEIAYDSGFNNPSYFTRVFRNRFGMVPTTFAKNSVK